MNRPRLLLALALAALVGGVGLFVQLGAADLPSAPSAAPAPPAKSPAQTGPLVWDALEKSQDAKPSDSVAEFSFTVTNRSDQAVTITELRPSCGCTVAEMPSNPWVLAPGAKSTFTALVDFAGKHGKFSKTIAVHSTAGVQTLGLTVNIAEPDEATRLRNQQLAAANRQAVFRGDCASCHVAPIGDKTGAELFRAACAICHLAEPRAELVADLMTPKAPRDAAYWRKWITDGREGSLMPGFAPQHGGPLTEAQIESLVEYAVRSLPSQPGQAPGKP